MNRLRELLDDPKFEVRDELIAAIPKLLDVVDAAKAMRDQYVEVWHHYAATECKTTPVRVVAFDAALKRLEDKG